MTRRSWLKIEINGETKSLAAWARFYGKDRHLVYTRCARGWNLLDALRTPLRPQEKITIKGQTRTLGQWAKRIGITKQAMWNRLQTNKSDDELIASTRRPGSKITAFGRTQSISEWAREMGIGRSCISWRLRQGMPVEVALKTPPRKQSRYKPKRNQVAP
jgi:hypothetical protein